MEQNNNSGNNPANPNFRPDQFTGTFTATGKQYFENIQTGILLKVCERKQPTQLKPPKYIVSRSTDGKFTFISSLYPTDQDNKFTAELQRVYFTVTLDTDKLIVSPKNQKG